MSSLEGCVSIAGLPPHRGLILSLCFFEVPATDSPPPYDGDPPQDAAIDCEQIWEQVDLDVETEAGTFECPFKVTRPVGFYYAQLRAILFRKKQDEVFAQTEQFFFGRRPLAFGVTRDGVLTLPVAWPTVPLESLHTYGTFKPQTPRPWWKFWSPRS
ncbi:MAG: hypothetical protein QM775_34985 [Pirellulales bacterium]